MSERTRFDIPVPLTPNDLAVLAWYAEWTPEVHRADWQRRRAWPPGFRRMADLSAPGFSDRDNTVENAEAKMMAGPALGPEKERPRGPRKLARSRLGRLLSYRLLEGSSHFACRLTARGRAALLLNGLPCPEGFASHCPEVFDDHPLVPINGVNARIDFDDQIMNRLDRSCYVGHGKPLPDDQTTWGLMLAEYAEDDHHGRNTLTCARAGLRVVSSTGHNLNGSIRTHHTYIGINVESAAGCRLLELSLSYEQLASLLVSNSDVPVTLDYYMGQDGMPYSEPAPPPISVSRRVQERIRRGNQDLQNRIRSAMEAVKDAKMPKGVQAQVLTDLEIALRDANAHGAFAAQQGAEELSSVAESLLTVMAESAALAGRPLLGGASPQLLLEGSDDPTEEG